MRRETVRRFSAVEIAFHWSQAVPYAALIVTGGLLFAQRLLAAEWTAAPALSLAHKIIGLVLVALILGRVASALAYGRFHLLLRTFRAALLWRARDVAWLARAPVHFLFHRVGMPAVGRLNPGQKIHVLLVAILVPLLAATGLAMMFQQGALAPWAAHVLLFAVACLHVGVHLFLSLVNPPTRPALSGMVSGHVPRDYALAHHPHWLGRWSEQTVEHRHVSRVAAAAAIAALALAAGLAVWLVGPDRLRARAETLREAGGLALLSPGPLSAPHAGALGPSQCMACHTMLRPPLSQACLECHPAIGERLASGIGYHGRLTGPCRECHGEHRGADADLRPIDAPAFNHALAAFPLNGRHQVVPCQACHLLPDAQTAARRTRYVGLAFASCTSCHKDPHAPSLGGNCTRCHTERGWTGRDLLFVHGRDTKFPLQGRHADVKCVKCHVPAPGAKLASAQMEGKDARCVACHRDPHAPSLGDDCTRCHTERGWTGRELLFVHNRDAKFSLQGKHVGVECVKCHVPAPGAKPASAQMKGKDTRCVACHKDPHAPSLGEDCTRCHTERGWTGRELLFVHSRDTKFPLQGRHTNMRCTKCHRPPSGKTLASAPMKGQDMQCGACHRDPHGGQFEKACSQCHTPTGFRARNLTFSHTRDAGYVPDRLHEAVTCGQCHGSGKRAVYRPLPVTCEGCHADVAQAMEGTLASAQSMPDPHAGRVACTECHPATAPGRSLGDHAADCAKCHNPRYAGLLYDWAKSLQEREIRATALLEGLRGRNDPRAADLARKIAEARAVGLHNVQLARRLWDEMLAAPAKDSGVGRKDEPSGSTTRQAPAAPSDSGPSPTPVRAP